MWMLQISAGQGGSSSSNDRVPHHKCLAEVFGSDIRKELKLPNSCLPPK